MKHSKLIRGVIYDNPNLVEEKTYETAEVLDVITDEASRFYDTVLPDCSCPSKDEFIVSTIIDAICRPSPDEENMIIPSSLVDSRLYGQLKKIDIGEDLAEAFIDLREEKFLDECEAKGISPKPMFDTLEEKVNHIEKASGIKPTAKLRKKLNIA